MRLSSKYTLTQELIDEIKAHVLAGYKDCAVYHRKGQSKGKLNVKGTCHRLQAHDAYLGAQPFYRVHDVLINIANDMGDTRVGRPMERLKLDNGMPFLPEEADLLRLPAVYRIICVPSGRFYIGSSMKPWMRRSVHLYWLRNITMYKQSNVFCRNEKILEDLDRYGVDSFRIEIMTSMPGATRAELQAEEIRQLKSHPAKQIYNRSIGQRVVGESVAEDLLKERYPAYKRHAENLARLRAAHKELSEQLGFREHSRERAELGRQVTKQRRIVQQLRRELHARLENTDLRRTK